MTLLNVRGVGKCERERITQFQPSPWRSYSLSLPLWMSLSFSLPVWSALARCYCGGTPVSRGGAADAEDTLNKVSPASDGGWEEGLVAAATAAVVGGVAIRGRGGDGRSSPLFLPSYTQLLALALLSDAIIAQHSHGRHLPAGGLRGT